MPLYAKSGGSAPGPLDALDIDGGNNTHRVRALPLFITFYGKVFFATQRYRLSMLPTCLTSDVMHLSNSVILGSLSATPSSPEI